MKRENWFLAVLTVAIILTLFFMPQIGWNFRNFMTTALLPPSNLQELEMENLRLKSELAALEDIKNQLPRWSPDYVRASVYVDYPFNFKNELLVSAGRSAGVTEGNAVFFNEFLMGKVDKVFEDSSLVRTIFDRRWQSAVRIGKGGVESLLVGGGRPRLTLIAKKGKIAVGDPVLSAAPDFPYGTPVAEVRSVGFSRDQLWQEADLTFPYEISDIRHVLIMTSKNARSTKAP